MNSEKQGYVVTSVIYRKFLRRPSVQLDNGIIIYTHVYAHNEEEAKVIAENQVQNEYFVDEYKFVKISKSENWMSERLAESNFIDSIATENS